VAYSWPPGQTYGSEGEAVTDGTWRPFGVDDEEQVAEYDALHDGVPRWMSAAFWAWADGCITEDRMYRDRSGSFRILRVTLVEELGQTLQLALPNLRHDNSDYSSREHYLGEARKALRSHSNPLAIADYLLAHAPSNDSATFDSLLERTKSAWRVGERFGKPGLVRRVPLGVQDGADSVIERSGRAGVRLAKAWGELYGLEPNASEAYRQAILAVEDAAIPVVSSTNKSATLGTVLKQIEDQGDWKLPMTRQHDKAPSGEVLIGMIRTLWHGQHDRHGGQPSAPGNVSHEEAVIAVGLATTLVHWFDARLVTRT
jgi:hypothetical protein